MTVIIDIEDTVRIHRPIGEETRFLGIQDTPTIARRPQSHPMSAEQAAFGLAATSTGEPPFIAHYAGRHRRPELPPLITPAEITPAEIVPPPVAPRPSLLARLLGRIGG